MTNKSSCDALCIVSVVPIAGGTGQKRKAPDHQVLIDHLLADDLDSTEYEEMLADLPEAPCEFGARWGYSAGNSCGAAHFVRIAASACIR